jgi:hypothetical protein
VSLVVTSMGGGLKARSEYFQFPKGDYGIDTHGQVPLTPMTRRS